MLSRFAFKQKNNQSFCFLFLFFLHVLVSFEFVLLLFHDLDVSTRCELSKKHKYYSHTCEKLFASISRKFEHFFKFLRSASAYCYKN
jgi:hypothetical protein